MPSALRTTSVPLAGAMVRMVTVVSPPIASFILRASSIAYSSKGLSTFSIEVRLRRLVAGSNVFSAFVSGTCLTVTTIFNGRMLQNEGDLAVAGCGRNRERPCFLGPAVPNPAAGRYAGGRLRSSQHAYA